MSHLLNGGQKTGAQGLEKLVFKWKMRAASKLADSESAKSKSGKRMIEHGAACYFNAAQELTEVLAAFGFRLSKKLKASRKP